MLDHAFRSSKFLDGVSEGATEEQEGDYGHRGKEDLICRAGDEKTTETTDINDLTTFNF